MPGSRILSGDDGRRLLLAAVGVIAVAIAGTLITGGTWDLSQPGFQRGYNDRFFTAQAEAILHGRLHVAPVDLPGECFLNQGRCYGYFGLTPSLLRIPAVLFGAHHAMSAVFLFLALSVGVIASLLLLDEVWQQAEVRATGLLTVVAVALGPGSLLFQLWRPRLYEEAIAWASALTVVALWLFVRWLRVRRLPVLLAALLVLTLAANARGTAGPVGVGLALVVVLVRVRGREVATAVALAVLPLGTSLLALYMKLGTARPSLLLHQQVPENPKWAAVWTADGGHDLHPQFIPTTLWAYLRPDSVTGSWQQGRLLIEPVHPFVKPMTYLWPLHRGAMYAEPTASLTVLALPALLLTLLALWPWPSAHGSGIFALRRTARTALLVGSGLGLIITLGWLALANRYLADFWPLLTLGTCMGAVVVARAPFGLWTRRAVTAALGLVVLLCAGAGVVMSS